MSNTMDKLVSSSLITTQVLDQLDSSSESGDDHDSDVSQNQLLEPPKEEAVQMDDGLDSSNAENMNEVSEFGLGRMGGTKWKSTFTSGGETAPILVSGSINENVGACDCETRDATYSSTSQARGLISDGSVSVGKNDRELDSDAIKSGGTENFDAKFEGKVDQLSSCGVETLITKVADTRRGPAPPEKLKEAEIDRNTEYIPLTTMEASAVNCSVCKKDGTPDKTVVKISSTDRTTENNCGLGRGIRTDSSTSEAVKKDRLTRLLERRLKEIETEADLKPEMGVGYDGIPLKFTYL